MRTAKYILMAAVALFFLLFSSELFCRGEEKVEENAPTVDVLIYKGVTTDINGHSHRFSLDTDMHYLASYIPCDILEVRSINPDNSVNPKAIFTTAGNGYIVNAAVWQNHQLIYSVMQGVKSITTDENDYYDKSNDPKYLKEHSAIYIYDPAKGETKKLLPHGAKGIYPSPSGKVLALLNMFTGVQTPTHNNMDIICADNAPPITIELPTDILDPIVVSWDNSEECLYIVATRNVNVTGVRDDGLKSLSVLLRIRIADKTVKQISPSYAIKNHLLNRVVIKGSEYSPPSFAAAQDTGVFACTFDENSSPDGDNAVTITKFNSAGVEHKLSRYVADAATWPEDIRKKLVDKSGFDFSQVTPTPDGESVLLMGEPIDVKDERIISETLYLWDLKNNKIYNFGVVPPINDAYGWLTDGSYYYSSSNIVANHYQDDIVVIKYHK